MAKCGVFVRVLQQYLTLLLIIFFLYSLYYIIIKQDIIDRDRVNRRIKKIEAEKRARMMTFEPAEISQQSGPRTLTSKC
ncbi:hypothetical protein Q1695_014884 [Nippostrongylus brasiliensis]|nr:hypothetical protein Q1695_014884 [Nippostrongylus brasiliensis]